MAYQTLCFADRVANCEQLLNKWKLGHAVQACTLLAEHFPNEPKSHHLRNLVICMSNADGGAIANSHNLIDAARLTLEERFSDELHGDMLRDYVFGATTFGTQEEIRRASKDIADIRELHANDPYRVACAYDAEARVKFALGDLDDAALLHYTADSLLGDLPQNHMRDAWMGNNLLRWLRVNIAIDGRKAESVNEIATRIENEHPGSKTKQARILCAPGGLRAFAYMLRNRM